MNNEQLILLYSWFT